MFNVIGIDWGSKRTGIALGDTSSSLSVPYQEEVQTQHLIKTLQTIIHKHPITTIVLGLPFNASNQDTSITLSIREFESSLKKLFHTITVETIDERFSTKDAQELISQDSITSDPHTINHLAAHTLLQKYFTQQNEL